MPIPDMPVRELVNMMYKAPEELELLVTIRKNDLLGEQAAWEPLEAKGYEDEVYELGMPSEFPYESEVRGPAAAEGYRTPTFGLDEAVRYCAM